MKRIALLCVACVGCGLAGCIPIGFRSSTQAIQPPVATAASAAGSVVAPAAAR
ncbi:MAG: hypothetical protein JSR18_02610 [Proteobacteria bacterium]|nr:hypothetical protein [Pseudomonadota bacterium]